MKCAWALALALLAGCSARPTQAPMETVEGRVVTQGRAVSFVLVTFNPDDGANADRYDGPTDKDGSFRLRCPKGRYRVTLSPLPVGASGDPGAGALVPGGSGGGKEVPARYRDKGLTPLNEDVPEGGKKGLTLDVK
jgi:hypothetical protein